MPDMRTLGVLMLDTRFPRIPGDIGHPSTFDFPVLHCIVGGASPRRVIHDRDPALLQPFIDAGRALVAGGATALTTSCGFLVLFQRELQAALDVPVWTSSLLQLDGLADAGVVTVEAKSLRAEHLEAAGAPVDTPIEGLSPGCAFQRTLLDDAVTLDVDEARTSTVAAALRLVERCPALSTIVLECTNMPPYAEAVRAATGRTVLDITTLLHQRFAT